MKILLECLESIGLMICIILAAPLSFFRRLDRLSEFFEHAPFLMRHRLFAALLRARLDYCMGHPHQAGVLLGPVVSNLEKLLLSKNDSETSQQRLLCLLYCETQKLYLLSGQIEEAVQLVIRAHKNLGIDRLPSNPDLDLKTAHVIRAGLAASKLLDEGGLATLMVRTGQEPIVNGGSSKNAVESKKKVMRNALKAKAPKDGATIIAFPGFERSTQE